MLQLITPVHEYEEVVPTKFLKMVKDKIAKRPEGAGKIVLFERYVVVKDGTAINDFADF